MMQNEQDEPSPCVKNNEDIILGKRCKSTEKPQKKMKSKAKELGFTPQEIKILNRLYKET